MDPKPRRTRRVSLSKVPKARAVSLACSGVCTSGAVATSTRGTPNRSRVYSTCSPSGVDLVSNFRALSSSKQMTSTPTAPDGVWMEPWVPISVVRWKPLVLEPSTTVLRIACSAPTGFAFIIAAMVNATSTASSSCASGGASSISMSPALGD